MDKMKMHSPDLSQENITKIRALFPDCVTEAADEQGNIRLAVDFDQLRQTLSDHIVEGPQERYRLDWPGKREALLTANAPIAKTLRPCREESVDFDTTQNLFIEGDNLDALKLLQESYLGKVKMIYIDPPYNTGNDFIYDDDFSENSDTFLLRSNQSDEQGGRLVANTDSNGRFHSDWLTMIYARLKIAKKLLSDQGVIFISIDDGEVHNTRAICNEVFGTENFVECFVWKKSYGGGPKEKYAVTQHEYVLMFAKDISSLPPFSLPYDPKKVERYYKGRDSKYSVRGPYRLKPLEATKSMDARPNLVYDVILNDGEVVKPKRQWLWSKERVLTALANDEVIVSGSGSDKTLNYKQYLRDENGVERGEKPFSVIDGIYTQHGTENLSSHFSGKVLLQFPKPIDLIRNFITFSIGDTDNPIILDFFAGSGTTAEACWAMASALGRNIRWISVQIPDGCEAGSTAEKAGFSTIAEISKERIRRAGNKVLEGECHEGWNRDVGFRVLKIDSSNMTNVFYRPDELRQDELFGQVDSVKPDRTGEDLLFQVLIDWGVELTLPINREALHGKTVYSVDGNALIACFDTGVTDELVKEIAARAPLRAVFRDTSFARDADRINAEQLFRQLSPGTELKAI
ncbi:site-specific DNA-methyltransferase [Novosphingobium sp.]|uniref:site-specific DNA-methyltransferase n=1 Tax=Novosphingobium sp. TaxID=1874826 RepID=UPI002624E475|nr:site-specific DNA-methyltransferase [Novosphingobium sp.]